MKKLTLLSCYRLIQELATKQQGDFNRIKDLEHRVMSLEDSRSKEQAPLPPEMRLRAVEDKLKVKIADLEAHKRALSKGFAEGIEVLKLDRKEYENRLAFIDRLLKTMGAE